jgi:uncharacterized membrane protein YkvA (DUF1232 family)
MLRLFRLWRLARKDLGLLWFALGHTSRPPWLLPALVGLILYAIEPLNFALPLFGVVDDFILVPLALHWLARFLPPQIRYDFELKLFAR